MKTLLKLASKNKLLTFIILVGLVLRLWGVSPGFPPYHPDEPQVYERAILILLGNEEKLGYYGYPGGVPLLHAAIYAVSFLPFGIISNLRDLIAFDLPFSRFLHESVIGAREINVMYWGRYTNALLGTLSILLTYLVGAKFFNRFVGLFAAAFLAVNYRHVLASHFALADVPNDLFLLLVFLASLGILKKGRVKDYIWAAIAAAVSFSAKFSPFALASIGVAHLFKNHNLDKVDFWKKSAYFSAAFVAAVVALNYFHILHWEDTLKDFNTLYDRYSAGIFEFMPFPYFYLYRWGLGPLVSVFTLAGILWALKNKPREALIIVLPVFLFFFSLTFYSAGGLYVRNFTAVIPTLLIFAACAAYFLYLRARTLAVVLILLALLPGAQNSLVLAQNYAKPWNFETVKEYMLAEVRQGSIAGTPWFLNHTYGDDPNVTKVEFGPGGAFSLAELQEAGADYVLLDTDLTEPELVWWMSLRWGPGGKLVWGKPTDLMRSSFIGGVAQELVALRTTEFVKPWQARETNFFLIKIPPRPKFAKNETVYEENFNEAAGWRQKSAPGKKGPAVSQIFDEEKCLGVGCVFIDVRSGTHQFLRYTSQPIELSAGDLYRVVANVRSEPVVPQTPGGVFKVELFRDIEAAASDRPGDIVFVSGRSLGSGEWGEKEVFVDVPGGYSFATVSFQVDRRDEGKFYFDDVVFEKGQEFASPERKDFPEDIIFINSIL